MEVRLGGIWEWEEGCVERIKREKSLTLHSLKC